MTDAPAAMPPYVHFDRDEFAARQRQVRSRMDELDLDALLVFKQEDAYWLTGFDSDGFCIFHCLVVGRDGWLTHVSRAADLSNLRYSSTCEDVYVWEDRAGNSRASAINQALVRNGATGGRVGVQVDTMGLTPRLHGEITDELQGAYRVVDAPDFIRELRLVKSPRELEYVRRAGAIVDAVRERVTEETRPGAFEGDLLATIYAEILRRDGDMPAHRPPVGNGTAAMNMRYTTGRKSVGTNDQVTFELGAGYRHYHAASMSTVLTGPRIDDRHLAMHAACVEALGEVQAALRPGRTLGELFDVYKAACHRHGYGDAILNAIGYTMGATWPPTWMEQPQIFAGNPTVLAPDMTFFVHVVLIDRDAGLTMSLGEQAIVTTEAPEMVTHVPREPVVRRPA